MVAVGLALLAVTLGVQQAPEITVGIRPGAIRSGDQAVVTVRVRSGVGLPEFVDWAPPAGIVLEDVRDRASAGIGSGGAQGWILEREYVLRGDSPGSYVLPPVQVALGGQLFEQGGPELSVSAVPLAWPRANRQPTQGRQSRERSDLPILPEGSPPLTGEMGGAYPGEPGAYGQWWGYPPYASVYPWGVPWYSPYLGGGYGTPSLYGPSLYPQQPLGQGSYGGSPTSPGYYGLNPYGPNGGWPLSPPGAAPGVDSLSGIGWPLGIPSWGFGWPGGYPPYLPGWPGAGGAPGGQASPGSQWQGKLGTPGPGASGTASGGPTLPPLPGGRWPEGMGGGWAETATGDPWWPEIVPELFEFSAWTESPGGEVSLGAAITPVQAFVGQQVTYVATAAMQPGAFLGLGADPEYLPPSPQGFWSVDLPDPLVASPSASGGRVAQSYTFRRALFPLQAGDYLIPPGTLLLPTASARPRQHWGGTPFPSTRWPSRFFPSRTRGNSGGMPVPWDGTDWKPESRRGSWR